MFSKTYRKLLNTASVRLLLLQSACPQIFFKNIILAAYGVANEDVMGT